MNSSGATQSPHFGQYIDEFAWIVIMIIMIIMIEPPQSTTNYYKSPQIVMTRLSWTDDISMKTTCLVQYLNKLSWLVIMIIMIKPPWTTINCHTLSWLNHHKPQGALRHILGPILVIFQGHLSTFQKILILVIGIISPR